MNNKIFSLINTLGFILCFIIINLHNFALALDNNIDKKPYFTVDWFSRNIKQWDKYKPMFYNKPNIHCLEIGSFEGASTLYLADNFCNGQESYLDALDTWKGSMENPKEHTEGI